MAQVRSYPLGPQFGPSLSHGYMKAAVVFTFALVVAAVGIGHELPPVVVLAPMACLIIWAVHIIGRMFNEGASVEHCDLLVYRGTWSQQVISLPIWEVRVEVQRSLLGRWLGYGTLVCWHCGQCVIVPHIAAIDTLHALILERRALALALLGVYRLYRDDVPSLP